MFGLKDSIDTAAFDRALTRANMRRLYGDDFELPVDDDKMLIGGDFNYVQPPVPVPPKRSMLLPVVTAILATILLMVAFAGGLWWFTSRCPNSSTTTTTPPAFDLPAEDYNAKFFNATP
jgi:hypothetical protein